MKKTIIAPIDSDSDIKVLLATLREFPTERMVLLSLPYGRKTAEDFSLELDRLGILASLITVNSTGNPWEDFFTSLSGIIEGIDRNSIIINVSTADRISQCALTNAAHVNGIRAVAVLDGQVMMLPILRLSFGSQIPETKMRILTELLEKDCSGSLEELSKRTGLSLQLVSYHVKGTPRSPGLSALELVDIHEEKGRMRVCLSVMGRLLMRGHVP